MKESKSKSRSTLDKSYELLFPFLVGKQPVFDAGSEMGRNSCYIDSTFVALFASSEYVYQWIVDVQNCKEFNKKNYFLLQKRCVVLNLANKFNKWSLVFKSDKRNFQHLLESDNEDLLYGCMADIEQLVEVLFRQTLRLKETLLYNQTSSYMHDIFVDCNKVASTLVDVNSLLVDSMKYQGLKFRCTPDPVLMIKMPKESGRWVVHTGVIPNLELDLKDIMLSEDHTIVKSMQMRLIAIITLRNFHYTTFLRKNCETDTSWYFYDSLYAMKVELPKLTQEIRQALNSMKMSHKCFSSTVTYIVRNNYISIYEPKIDMVE